MEVLNQHLNVTTTKTTKSHKNSFNAIKCISFGVLINWQFTRGFHLILPECHFAKAIETIYICTSLIA